MKNESTFLETAKTASMKKGLPPEDKMTTSMKKYFLPEQRRQPLTQTDRLGILTPTDRLD